MHKKVQERNRALLGQSFLETEGHMRRVNLFLIGAQKSGTTSLYVHLKSHPDIYMCPSKEPSHFIDEQCMKGTGLPYYPRLNDYHQLFEGAGNRKYIGEASTLYTKAPKFEGAPKRIFDYNPDAKLIYVMRDPVERVISHYWHWVRQHRERRPIMEAITQEPHYLWVSRYEWQLSRFFQYFSKEQIKLVVFEKFVLSPSQTMQDIYRWLGVGEHFVPPGVENVYYENPVRIKTTRSPWIDALVANNLKKANFIYKVASRFLSSFTARTHLPCPALGLAIFRLKLRFLHAFDRATRQDAVDYLKSELAEPTLSLGHNLNVQIDPWQTLFDCSDPCFQAVRN